MSEDDLENDELEGADEDEDEELDGADSGDVDGDGDDEAPVATTSKKSKAAAMDVDELPSVEAKQKDRDALAKAMEAFLARGGKVQEVDDNVVADPPKKPDSKYGSRPI